MILIFLTIANIVVGVLLFMLRPPGTPVESASRPPVLPAQVQALQDAVEAGHHGESFELVLSDAELTAVASYYQAQASEMPFGNIAVSVLGDQIVVDGVTRGLAVAVPVRASAVVATQDGLPAVRVRDVSLGAVPIPGAIRERILREVNTGLDFSRYPMPLAVEELVLRPGELTIRGSVK